MSMIIPTRKHRHEQLDLKLDWKEALAQGCPFAVEYKGWDNDMPWTECSDPSWSSDVQWRRKEKPKKRLYIKVLPRPNTNNWSQYRTTYAYTKLSRINCLKKELPCQEIVPLELMEMIRKYFKHHQFHTQEEWNDIAKEIQDELDDME